MFQSKDKVYGCLRLSQDSLALDGEGEPHSRKLRRTSVRRREDEKGVNKVSLSGYEHFRSSLFLSENSIVAFLTGYFDESYSHPPRPLVYTIAGYISEDWRWRKFDTEWRRLLDREGIDFFHMYTLNQRLGLYADWPEKKRKKFLRSLHYIIKSNTIADFAVNVVVKDYDEMVPVNGAIRPEFGEPHVFAAVGCMKDIHNWAEAKNIKDLIHYVFEKGTIHDVELRRIFGSFDEAANQHYRSRGVSFLDKRHYLPLQAADVVAYENMSEIRRKIDPASTQARRPSYKNLERSASHWVFYDKEELKLVFRDMIEQGLIIPALMIEN